ncbi:MAG: hypothetical protein LQ346_007176 [Caloplaca aetnensis]|nr:MAG: hypothetical protein LQ346_007176 [Caloplaca aetnensis]
MAGRKIFRKRAELRAFRQPSRASVDEPFSGFKTTEVCVSSELAGFSIPGPPGSCFDAANPASLPKGYEQYSANINSSPPSTAIDLSPRTSSQSTTAYKRYKAALDANTAAWGYTKVALLFFVSLCVTWIPSSINRIYDLANPYDVSYPLNFVSAIVLPLMGFWNGIIYFVTTRAVCKAFFWNLADNWAPKKKSTSARSPRSSTSMTQPLELGRSKAAEGSMLDSLTRLAKEKRGGDNLV